MPKRNRSDSIPSTIEGFRKSDQFILESQLTPYDFVPRGVDPCGIFSGRDPIYLRSQVVKLFSKRTLEANHMRTVSESEKPKRVISKRVGAVDRTIELFSLDQSEPLPALVASLEAGIPANEYGNVDINRIPANAELIETDDVAAAMRICKSLDIICNRCQNGWKRKRPTYAGVVVLSENAEIVREALENESLKRIQKDEEARTEAALAIWRVLLRRIEAEYFIRTKL